MAQAAPVFSYITAVPFSTSSATVHSCLEVKEPAPSELWQVLLGGARMAGEFQPTRGVGPKIGTTNSTGHHIPSQAIAGVAARRRPFAAWARHEEINSTEKTRGGAIVGERYPMRPNGPGAAGTAKGRCVDRRALRSRPLRHHNTR